MAGPATTRVVVLASGNGTNLQALIDACSTGCLAAEITAVLSDRPEAGALARAQQAGIDAVHLAPVAGERRDDYDVRLALEVSAHAPDLVVLAGWMRLLSRSFLDHFPNAVINVHPALPGDLPGIRAIERAWDEMVAGQRQRTGVMVHFVPDAGVDDGPVLTSSVVEIAPGETLESLTARIHEVEHRLLVQSVRRFCVDPDATIAESVTHRPSRQRSQPTNLLPDGASVETAVRGKDTR